MINPFTDDTEYRPLRLEPLRIISKPYKTVISGRKQWQFHLSDGKIVNLYQLAEIVGISQPSMWQRLQDLEWKDSNMMVKRRKRRHEAVDLSHIEKGKYCGLSDKPRCI